MHKNTAFLICTLIGLSVTVPMLSGCRHTGGPKHHFSSWEFYNPFSRSNAGSDYDETALAQQFQPLNDPHDLPKVDVASHGDYLQESRGTRLLVNSVPPAKPQAVDSLFDQSGTSNAMASNSQTPQYGTVSPIDQGFGTSGGDMGLQANNSPMNVGTQIGPYSPGASQGQPQGHMTTANPNDGMYAGMMAGQSQRQMGQGQLGQQPFNAGTPMFGQQPDASQTAYNPSPMQGPNGVTPYNGMTSPNNSQQIASAQGTGYVGQTFDYGNTQNDMSYGMTMPNTPVTGFPNPTVPSMTGNPGMTLDYSQGYQPQGTQPGVVGQQPPANVGQNMTFDMNSAAHQGTMTQGTVPQGTMTQGTMTQGATNMYDPTGHFGVANPSVVNANTASPYGTPNTMTTPQTSTMQQPAGGTYQNGFNYFAPTGDDVYQPGSTGYR